jgi:transcription termination factor NusB
VRRRKRILAIYFLYKIPVFEKKKWEEIHALRRRYWVHPINTKRLTLGVFYTLFEELRNDGDKFFNYFRMSVTSFDELHDKLQNVLQRQDTVMRDCIETILQEGTVIVVG